MSIFNFTSYINIIILVLLSMNLSSCARITKQFSELFDSLGNSTPSDEIVLTPELEKLSDRIQAYHSYFIQIQFINLSHDDTQKITIYLLNKESKKVLAIKKLNFSGYVVFSSDDLIDGITHKGNLLGLEYIDGAQTYRKSIPLPSDQNMFNIEFKAPTFHLVNAQFIEPPTQ